VDCRYPVDRLYNHFLHRLNRTDSTSAYSEQKLLPSLKKWWSDLKDVHSKVLQKVVQRLYDNLSVGGRQERRSEGRPTQVEGTEGVPQLTYSQSGFKLKNTSSRTRLWLSKLGDISLTFHRDLPDDIEIKTITVKQEPTGKWYAILGVETPTTRPQNWRIPSSASVSTWGFSSTPTIRTARQLSHSTSPTSVNGGTRTA